MPLPSPLTAAAVLALALAAPASWRPALAQQGQELPAPVERLERVEKELEAGQEEHRRLQREVEALGEELATVRAGLVKAAAAAQEHEETLTQIEAQIHELQRRHASVRGALNRRGEQTVRILMALERLAWRPTEALIAQPLAPADTVRSAILLRSALPQIQSSATEMKKELATLAALRAEITARHDRMAVVASKLAHEHASLKALFERKAGIQRDAENRSREAARRVRDLAREAVDLKELMAKLEEERRHRVAEEKRLAEERRKAEEARRAEEKRLAEERRKAEETRRVEEQRQAEEARRAEAAAIARAKSEAEAQRLAEEARKAEDKRLAAEARRLEQEARRAEAEEQEARRRAERAAAVNQPDKPWPSRPFSEARGRLPMPARGRVVTGYGQVNDVGLTAKGITIRTRPNAQVIAPFDGTVVFSGQFRGYGQLLIIEHGEGYHTLLAGMTRIDAEVGHRLVAGEPIGMIEGETEPALYVELRREGQPINPMPWLTAQKGNTRG